MISQLLIAGAMMSLCVAIHALGLSLALRWLSQQPLLKDGSFLLSTWILIKVAAWTLSLHLIEISLWALIYFWKDCMVDMDSAFYFSAVTYTTTGYGDLVLPKPWRLVGAIEALTGILMCGWSTGFFFTVVSRSGLVKRSHFVTKNLNNP